MKNTTDNAMVARKNYQILPNGVSQRVRPRQGDKFTLEELQEAVGGYLQPIYLNDEFTMYVNEDGKFMGLPLNQAATFLAYSYHAIGPRDFIVGSAVVVANEYFD